MPSLLPQMQHNTNISNTDPLSMIDNDFDPSKPSPIKFDQSCSIKDEDKQASLANLQDIFGPGTQCDSTGEGIIPPNIFEDEDVTMEGIQEETPYSNFFSSRPIRSGSSSITSICGDDMTFISSIHR